MAVIYAENSCNLSDVNAFYRVEAYNLGVFSTVSVSLGSLQTVPVTFANAGNFRGVLLSLFTTAATTNRGVAVAFQENVSGTWTTIETITLTADQIHASSNKLALATFVPFRFTPYTVTNAANKYRFTMIHSGGTTGTWYTRTSNGTAPFYAVWADNALSFTDNDCVIAEGKVTINQTATFRGVLGTGDTTRSVCAICVRDSNPTIDNAPTFLIPNPASPITLTIDGLGGSLRIASWNSSDSNPSRLSSSHAYNKIHSDLRNYWRIY